MIKNTCDGTGVVIPDDTPTTGFLGHQYCDEARPIAEKYLEELDSLHTKHSEAFTADLVALRARYSTLAQLPDES